MSERQTLGETWSRDTQFPLGWTDRPLSEFVAPPTQINWTSDNPYEADSQDELQQWIEGQGKWRHHHNISFLKQSESLYTAYSDRVDTMLTMLDHAVDSLVADVSDHSFVDIAGAEGYVANHLFDRGVRDIDSCDINEMVLERAWRVRAFTDRSFGRVGHLDLENVAWSGCFERRYDVVLALGIVYHVENPLLFCRNLRELTQGFAIVESDTPVFPNNERFRGFGNIYLHRDQVTLRPGDIRYFTELRPDRLALVEMLLNAGFSSVEVVPTPGGEQSRYFESGEKSMLIAHV